MSDKVIKSAIGSTALDRLVPRQKDVAQPQAVKETESTKVMPAVKEAKVTKGVKVKPLRKVKLLPSKKSKKQKPKKAVKSRKTAKTKDVSSDEKVRFTVLLSKNVVDQLRNIVVFSPGATLADAAETAIGAYVKLKAKSFPHGTIPSRGGLAVKTGRPIR